MTNSFTISCRNVGLDIFLHYLIIAFRNMRKYKNQTLISVIGLATGFTCFAFAMLWIRYEMSFDNFHKNAKQMYVIYRPACKSVTYTEKRICFTHGLWQFGTFAISDAHDRIYSYAVVCPRVVVLFYTTVSQDVSNVVKYSNGFVYYLSRIVHVHRGS